MRIFLAGATGAIGKRLVPLLVADGHHVVATTRSQGKIEGLRAAGADPVVVDALDHEAVMKAVVSARPEVIVHQLTALAGVVNFKKADEGLALTNRLRTEGTDLLLAAGRAAGARRFVAQSYTGWPNAREGTRIKTEDDPLDPDPPPFLRKTLQSIRELEAMVTGASALQGVVLRYGSFYGPGTSVTPGGDILEMVRRRRFPVLGNGQGVWSFIHVDDAAQATRLAIQAGPPGIYNIVDDEPAEVSVWLPDLARAIGAKPPFHLPLWLGKLVMGEVGASIMTRVRGSSNAKAKRLLGWQPLYPSWRDGFRRGLGGPPSSH